MSELVPGGNQEMPRGAITIRVPGPFDLSALITGESGKVSGDADFVFFNQPSAPGVRLSPGAVTVDPRRLRPGAGRVTVVVSPAEPGTPLGRLPVPAMRVVGPGGAELAGFTPPRVTRETVLLLAELYRRGDGWKLRALGQGYAEGLAGVARDFGVDVVEDAPPPPPAARPRGPRPPAPPPRPPRPSRPTAPAVPPRPARPPQPVRGAPPVPHQRGFPGHPPPGAYPPPTQAYPPPTQAYPPPTQAYPPPTQAYPPPGLAVPSPGRVPASDVEGFAAFVNAERASAAVPPVVLESRLVEAARQHATAMAVHGALGVETPDGVSVYERIGAHGFTCLVLTEHLVSGPRSVTDFVEYCLTEGRTRAPFTDPAFSHIGVGHATAGPSGDVYWTALWASPFTREGLAGLAAEVVRLTSAERTSRGLGPLTVDPRLTAAAQAHSDDMVARDFYSHTTPEGRQPWDRAAAAGSTHRGIGENIACGQRTAAEVVRGWMESPGHRANILKPGFTHIGIGYATGSKAGTYWTQLFGMAG